MASMVSFTMKSQTPCIHKGPWQAQEASGRSSVLLTPCRTFISQKSWKRIMIEATQFIYLFLFFFFCGGLNKAEFGKIPHSLSRRPLVLSHQLIFLWSCLPSNTSSTYPCFWLIIFLHFFFVCVFRMFQTLISDTTLSSIWDFGIDSPTFLNTAVSTQPKQGKWLRILDIQKYNNY